MKQLRHIFSPLAVFLIGMAAALAFSACDDAAERSAAANADAMVKTYQSGPFEVELRVSEKELSVAEQLTLEISATAAEDVDVNLPEFKDSIGEFRIADQSGRLPKLIADHRVRHAQIYRLKPFLSGEYQIPSMTVTFVPVKGPEPSSREIQTEALMVRVNSVLPEAAAPRMKAIMPPEPLPEKLLPWLIGGTAMVLLMGLAGFWGWRRFQHGRKAAPARVIRPAHEVAEAELQQLLSENLVADGYYKLFYQRLSGILRRYIEARFGLRAPEQTTEEFLKAMRTADELTTAQKQQLKSFLIHCDQVKFAEHQPAHDEIEKMMAASRQFIAETRLRPNSGGTPHTEAGHHEV